jgi:Flp pilus assembly secretin CpaC
MIARSALPFAGFCLLSISSWTAGAEAQADYSVPVGKNIVVDVPAGTRAAVSSDPRVATVQPLSDSQILVTGKTRGNTTITLDRGENHRSHFTVSVGADEGLTEVKAEESSTLRLSIGRQTSIKVKGLKRVAIGDPRVAEVSVVDRNEILVTGLATGQTSVLLWVGKDRHVSYLIKVDEKSPQDLAEELRAVLAR